MLVILSHFVHLAQWRIAFKIWLLVDADFVHRFQFCNGKIVQRLLTLVFVHPPGPLRHVTVLTSSINITLTCEE